MKKETSGSVFPKTEKLINTLKKAIVTLDELKYKSYYKVSLYDDMDNEHNRLVLKSVLSPVYFSELDLNNRLTEVVEKLNSPMFLTAICVTEYDLENDERLGQVTWSELNERLKLNN